MKGLQQFKEEISFKHNGVLVEAVVFYSSKDYKIKILNPVDIELKGKHLPYAVSARYVMNERSIIPGVKNINISKRCKMEIIEALMNK